MKNRLIQVWTCSLALLISGCSDFLSEYSQDMIVPSKVSDLDEALLGSGYIESTKASYGSNNGICGFLNILDDDVNLTGGISEKKTYSDGYTFSVHNMFGYYAWQMDVRRSFSNEDAGEDDATWNSLYNRIAVANIVLDEIEELPHNTDEEQATYTRVKGEAHFLRAQFYFMLVNLYGDAYTPTTCATKLSVPLKLTPYVEYDKNKPTQFTRATVKEVYDQIVKDLLAAEVYLTESPQKANHRLHRATWEAADLLLSRVYLYMQDWENATLKAEQVMKTKIFNIAPISSLGEGITFLSENSPEVIFSQGRNNITNDGTWSFRANQGGYTGDYCVTRELYDMYEVDDARKTCFFQVGDASTDSVALATKYFDEAKTSGIYHVSDVFTLRMSEALLNYAEACAMQSGKETQANKALNDLRLERIENYVKQNYTGAELVKQIRDERRKELCFEGHRWFDLRRYAVCAEYPYSRDIIHSYHEFSTNSYIYVTTIRYKLPAGDPAYTFSLPNTAIEDDVVPMPDNERFPREPLDEAKKDV